MNRAQGARVRAGKVLKGRYVILQQIGRGGMSRVYLAADRELDNKHWAVKEIDRASTDAAGRPIEQSLEQEARLLSGISHRDIINIVDIVKTDRYVYAVMDHVPGKSLADVVRAEGPQSEADVQKWMLEVCDAVGYLHRRRPPIIHRDMKPGNLMLHEDGYIKLIDLGAAVRADPSSQRDAPSYGTRGYASPEQCRRGALLDCRADIYGMGATMWHLLAGEKPPERGPLPDVRTVNPKVGEGFAERIIPKCCEPDPDKRYQSCEELKRDLLRYETLTRAYRAGQVKRVRLFAVTAALSAVLLAGGFTSLALREQAISTNFGYQLDAAKNEMQTDLPAAERSYQAAIELRPGSVEGYEGLIECYKADGSFTTEERAQFNDSYEKHLGELKASDRYAELEYELGRLYWYYYAYGQSGTDADNRAVRIKASADHFKVAASDPSFDGHEKAAVYDGIAQFTSGIASAVKTDDDDMSMYRDYWKDLEDLQSKIANDSASNETIELDSYALVENALETYMDKFKKAGVKQSEAEALFSSVSDGLNRMQPVSDDAKKRRQSVRDRLENEARRKIATVYSGAVVGQD